MQKFKFRLEALLKVRLMEEEQAQVKVAEATQLSNIEKSLLNDISVKLAANLTDIRNKRQQLPTVDTLNILQLYDDKLRVDRSQQQSRLEDAENYRQQCIRQLEIAIQQRKLVEKLRDKKLSEFNFSINQEEQKSLDEIGIQLYTRKS